MKYRNRIKFVKYWILYKIGANGWGPHARLFMDEVHEQQLKGALHAIRLGAKDPRI